MRAVTGVALLLLNVTTLPRPILAQTRAKKSGEKASERHRRLDPMEQREIKELAMCTEVDVATRNETWCIGPVIQLGSRVKVRLVPKAETGGRRAFYLLTQGLRSHPMVELVGSPPRLCQDMGYTLDHSGCTNDVTALAEKAPDADVAIFIAPATDPKL